MKLEKEERVLFKAIYLIFKNLNYNQCPHNQVINHPVSYNLLQWSEILKAI
jgi:hypothetical protein